MQNPVGASLLAKAAYQPPISSPEPPHSRASSLPQVRMSAAPPPRLAIEPRRAITVIRGRDVFCQGSI
ncbi:hypothetical protein C1894_21175 [Pseudomonas sp. FW305-3-2-15-E-TSA2]|nr:hypothetical protein C1895_21595 [Pseudomonas sp. FW305-3-2-15-E-TSA4]POA38567.1 hypothetical protein C1894_21175 [Pseudomonas sp. FW305-3-2-15-E-TSA2]